MNLDTPKNMTTSGAGRGRGWLKLNKNLINTPLQLGLAHNNSASQSELYSADEIFENTHDTENILDTENTELLKHLESFHIDDDGIAFNRKLKQIFDFWIKNCKTDDDVLRSFVALFKTTLHNEELVNKLVTVVCCRTHPTAKTFDINLKKMFLMNLQETFENRKIIQINDPIAFRNAVLMHSLYYNKALVPNGDRFTILAKPLIIYLEMLLESTKTEDLKLFTLQFYVNGIVIKQEHLDNFLELLWKIRKILVSDKPLSKEGKLWLLLAIDISNRNFLFLSTELYRFYEENLGASAITHLQKPSKDLTIQTNHCSSTFDNYRSNVLQVSPQLEVPNPPEATTLSPNVKINNDFSFNTIPQKSTQAKETTIGRPILGSGAHSHKNKLKNDYDKGRSHQNHKHKDSSNTWNNKEKSQTLKSNKGWEHDDRFENDYN